MSWQLQIESWPTNAARKKRQAILNYIRARHIRGRLKRERALAKWARANTRLDMRHWEKKQ